MKLKNNLLILLCCATLLGSAGCKKALEQQPTASFSDANAFRTLNEIQLGVNGAYGRYSAYANDMYVNALLSDEAKLGAGNAGQGALTYRYQFGSDGTTGGDVVGAYYSYYSLIDQVNRVLAQIDKVAINPGEEARREVLRGQLLALRAISHFSLLEMYADRYDATKPGIPLMLTSCATCKPARNTMGEVVSQIDLDLSTAKSLMPAVTAATFTDTVMNSLNVTGYQARIALWKRDYANAVTYATTVINSNIRPLATGTNFKNIWTDASKTQEVLFRRLYTGTGIGGLWTTTGGDIYIAPSDKLVSSYSASDIRLTTYIGNTGGNNYVNKFYTSGLGGRVVDIKAMRIAEMYLIRAEAYAKLSTPNLASGAADLNTLRAARIAGYTPVTFTTASDLITAVLDERFKELAFEGFRWFDLKRNNLPVQRLSTDANAAWQTLPADSYRWLLPIPREEIIANPNTTQNPGY
jgi:starch-binding outer membrane protein, SusD/RagB family